MFQETKTTKKFHIFSQKEAVLIFQETETLINFLYFSKRNFPSSKNEEKNPYS